MILNISGPSGSGKTTLAKKACELYPNYYSRLIPYTTRTKRQGEQNGTDYWFISIDQYNFYHEWQLARKSTSGFYGTKKEDLTEYPTPFLLTTFPPRGVMKMRALDLLVHPFYLNLPIEECQKRMKLRGDTEKSISERIKIDENEVSLDYVRQTLFNDNILFLDAMQSIDDILVKFLNLSKHLL
jgi:guanylate kinase